MRARIIITVYTEGRSIKQNEEKSMSGYNKNSLSKWLRALAVTTVAAGASLTAQAEYEFQVVIPPGALFA